LYSRRAFRGHEDEFDLLTILRNPLDRTLSQYYFSRFNERRDHFPIDCELSEWLLTDRAKSAAMTLTKMFVGDIDVLRHLAADGNKHDMREAASEAIKNLRTFAIVGTLERLGDFERAIRHRYGITSKIGHLRKNPIRDYPKFAEQPPQVQDSLRELCQEDMAIYETFRLAPPSDEIISGVRCASGSG
jgi:hypothetical protein